MLFALMHPKLLRYAMRDLDDETANEAAIDALQAVWAKQVPAPTTDMEHRKVQSLCYRVLDGLILNALRGERRRGRLLHALQEEAATRPQSQPDVSEVLESAADLMLESLRHTDREMLTLLLDGYSVSEIAIIIDRSPAAVSMRLKRAKENLRRLVGRTTRRPEGLR